MPLNSYGVLRAIPVDAGREDDDPRSPHFQIIAEAGGVRWRIPVNVRSSKNQTNDPNRPDKSLVLFRLEDPLTNTVVPARLSVLTEGFHDRTSGAPALDYFREPLFDKAAMQIVKFTGPDVSDDVQDILEVHVRRAIANRSPIFAFGEPFDATESPRPPDVQFRTTRGVHDIHMNQGNPPPGSFFEQNGVFQDGAVLIRHSDDRWIAFFVAFQTQLLPTDDVSGKPLPGAKPIKTVDSGMDTSTPSPSDGPVQIVAAMVNPTGADTGLETVTILNVSADPVTLDGWKLIDKNQRAETLAGVLGAGDARRVRLSGAGAQLSNDGGTIQLRDGAARLMHAVTYSKAAAGVSGVTLRF